ncbi:WXG100 family type VII secretion target [Cellulomonas carbonis]|uniref:ESAT-6-like protein n=1 Tax=Cellulomonas carbonis T26 TaxID=947969 RepID=A0A0A0BRG0_9CELL|nr:WXG100 family type VII secretion target [Cellulomonas carbonis]KGM09684.1 type VII secretion protein [Cellulomonas carbonis T26]MDT0167026.1 WXG100 family type VII secretion target [Actinotalea sp. AC32]GGC05373.1 ESAT-6-like protein [Cellulomonas carbonis]
MRYEVDSAQVSQAAAATGRSVAAVRAEVAALVRHLTDLQDGWRGSAATAFAGVLAEWTTTQQRVEHSLDQITAALDAAARTYADAEQQASRLFGR